MTGTASAPRDFEIAVNRRECRSAPLRFVDIDTRRRQRETRAAWASREVAQVLARPWTRTEEMLHGLLAMARDVERGRVHGRFD